MYSKRTRFDYRSRIRRKRIVFLLAALLAAGTVTAVVIPFSSRLNGNGRPRREILRHWENGSFDEVFRLSQAALELRPADYFLLTMHGFSAYQLGISQINSLDAARYFNECTVSLRRAMLLRNSAGDGRLYYVLGKAYSYKGESYADLVIKYLEKARELSYNIADIPEYLGMAYASIGDYRSSVAAFSEALNPRGDGGYSGQSGLLHLSIAGSYFALNEYETARAYLLRCIDVSRDSNILLQAKLLLAQVLENTGDTDGAIRHLTEILDESGDIAEVHYRIGELYARQGETARARASWRQAIRADPAHASARVRLSM